MTDVFHMPVTVKEARELKKLDDAWDSIPTVVGLFQYYRILGPQRTKRILEALGKKQKVMIHIIKVMVCGRCELKETLAPITEGEQIAIGNDPRYRCFACRKLEEAGL